MPNTTEEWKILRSDLKKRWNFPHCVAAIDGKHVVMRFYKNSGSLYFSKKGTFSIVLMAVVGADY